MFGPRLFVSYRRADSEASVRVLQRSRVRVCSLEVFFGRVFGLLRNKFKVSSETVVAEVEGTRFVFEVAPDRAVGVTIAEGTVVCNSPKSAWAPIRLRANEALISRYPSRVPPAAGTAESRELRAYEALSGAVSRAREPAPQRGATHKH